ncbi:sensor histidine kinase [Ammoniphilus resinae]|uniref:histidine kinase n=1 Tax=Ammoniphilus resinae TaxID=861532 RepID=A0ABS4GVA2_9BACL|nr:ATP-binding protein [Ammoniphilus resinae]MBP1933805.1 signal transduction histidine kinase [Ammoniphilus resinae]
MNFNWLPRFRNWKADLFIHTQTRLTFLYSITIMIFLTLFVAIVYFLVDTVISFDQERRLQSITDQEMKVLGQALIDHTLSQEELENLNTIRESGNQFFYYIVDPQGQVLFGDAFIPRLQPKLLHQIEGWIPSSHEIRYGTVKIPPPRRGPDLGSPSGRVIELMITGRAIYQGNQLVGMFYTGKDVSFINQLLEQLLTILVILGILFLGVALWLSYFMSKRAMIPIRKSFDRQREFVADASHELRTPLSILNSSLDVVEMEDGDQLSDYSRKVLRNMKDEVKRMTHLVSDLLTLARSDSGVPELKLDSFDLVPSAIQLVGSAQTLANSKEIKLNLQTPESLIVNGDHDRLKQLIYILLDNAIKYTPSGGEVDLTLTKEQIEKQSALHITVKDTGLGIPEEDQERIFDRFYRVDKNRSRQMGGTGLGLAIAKWIVNAHHGTIEVSSIPGEGSTFSVNIPVYDVEEV